MKDGETKENLTTEDIINHSIKKLKNILAIIRDENDKKFVLDRFDYMKVYDPKWAMELVALIEKASENNSLEFTILMLRHIDALAWIRKDHINTILR
jgi:isopentenyldiphosphate isomerase